MPNERCGAIKEFQTEPGNRIALMDWLTAVTFEALEQIVGQQLDQQIQTIGFEITCRNAIDGKPVLGFLNVIFHAAALIVESPQIDRFPFQISHHGFVQCGLGPPRTLAPYG